MEDWKRRLIEKATAQLVGFPSGASWDSEQLRTALGLHLGKVVTGAPIPRIRRDGEPVFN